MEPHDSASGSSNQQPASRVGKPPLDKTAEEPPWILVDVTNTATSDGYESDGSIVHVSRASSPVTVTLTSLNHLHLDTPSISWPSSLPWFQFQDRYMKNVIVQDMFALYGANPRLPKTSSGSSLMLFSKDLRKLATPQGIQRGASELAKFMPESEPDENIRRVEALVGENPAAAKQEEIQLFVYQLSNNLIDDPEDEYIDEEGEHTKIMTIYESIGLSRAAWKATFAQILEHPTGRAFVEKLFEAAVGTSSLDTCELLLEAGAHPDQLIKGWGSSELRRPIQVAAARPWDSAAFVRLLIRFGAQVDLVTEDEPETALLRAAKYCDVETVRILVEAGATLTLTDSESRFSHVTALARTPLAAFREAFCYLAQVELDKRQERQERRGLATLKYLLPLYDVERDHDFIQTALTVAVGEKRKDMLQPLLDAGATVNGRCPNGYTPLIIAVAMNYKDNCVPVASALLDLGADPNIAFDWDGSLGPRAIHIAAIRGYERMVELLIHAGADLNSYAKFEKEELGELLELRNEVSRAEPGDVVWDLLRCRTPLQFALYRAVATESKRDPKGGSAALALLRAGATLSGREFARAPAVDSADVLNALLQRGVDVNEVDWRGFTALQNCLRYRSTGLVGLLLEAGVKLRGGELLEAVRTGNRETVELLLRYGATNTKGQSTPSLLVAAAESKNWDLFRWLIESHGEGYDESALCTAVGSGIGHEENGDEEALVALLDKRPARAPGRLLEASALGYAAFDGQTHVVDRLVALGITGTCIAPLDGDDGYHTLVLASVWDLQFAYKRYSWRKPTGIRCSVLALAIVGREWDIIEELLSARCLPDRWSLLVALNIASLINLPDSWTPSKTKEYTVNTRALILRLTEHMTFADINERAHPKFDTPLQAAARYRRSDIVRHLLSLGVDVNAAPSVGMKSKDNLRDPLLPRTALQAAVENGDLGMIDLLLDAGADVNSPVGEDSGATALQLAAGNGHIGIARKLIGLGADVNAAEAWSWGRTALEAAAERGRLDMVQFLLESGARRSDTEREGGLPPFYWPIKLAKARGHGAIVRMLRDWRRRCEEGEEGVVGDYESPGESDEWSSSDLGVLDEASSSDSGEEE